MIYTMLDPDKNAGVRPQHVAYLTNLLRQGKIETGWKFPDYKPGQVQGFLICNASSKEEVEGWFEQDPVIMAGARTFQVLGAQFMQIRAD